ncbi:MAG: polymer-forming cytoskeletal protein [Xanthomonadales bacterium]|nr:polymer-forming cytoskeletal protein [Xanthomonadales bacterium]
MFDKQRNSKQGQSEAKGSLPENAHGSATSTTNSPSLQPRKAAVIGSGIQVNGDITGDENLVIEGKVDGSIKLDANEVSIGQSGRVKADVSARVVKIDGNVDGDIHGQEKVVITRSGNVRGNIKAPRVTLEDGAIFKGSIDMDPGELATERDAAAAKKTNGKSLGTTQGTTQPMNLEGEKDSAYSSKSG